MKLFPGFLSIIQILSLGSLIASASVVASESDFICTGDRGKPDPKSGICKQTAECAYLPVQAREQITASFNKGRTSNTPLEKILAKDRVEMLAQLKLPLTFRPAVLTCNRNEDGECPIPESCKEKDGIVANNEVHAPMDSPQSGGADAAIPQH